MNCNDFERCWTQGNRIGSEALSHASSCPRCQALLALQVASPTPDPTAVKTAAETITRSLQPVRPLPSVRRQTATLFCFFCVFAVGATAALGRWAVPLLGGPQAFLYYGIIAFLTLVLSAALAQQMIPGAPRRFSPVPLIAGPLFLLIAAVPIVFPRFSTSDFIHRGLPCFITGCICAALAGIVVALFLRRGFLTAPLETSIVAGLFSGVAGFAVLALHCRIFSAPHVWAWHLGPVLLSGFLGALVGVVPMRVRLQSREP